MHGCRGANTGSERQQHRPDHLETHLLTGGYDSCPELATRMTGSATCARRAGSSLNDCMMASITQAGVLVMPAYPDEQGQDMDRAPARFMAVLLCV
jgi:hypothetical protein